MKQELVMLSAEEQYAAIYELLKKQLSRSEYGLTREDLDEIDNDTTFSSLGLDSLDRVEIVIRLEKETGIQVPDEDTSTIGQMIQLFTKIINR